MWDETGHALENSSKDKSQGKSDLDFFEEKVSIDLKKYIDDIENHHIDAINELKKCINCNYCKNVTSTFQISKMEKDSHSSKLYLINEFNRNRNKKKIIHTIYNVSDPSAISKVCPCNINHEKAFLELRYKTFVDMIQDENYAKFKLALDNLKSKKYENIWGEKVFKKYGWLSERENFDANILYYISSFEGLKERDRIKHSLWFLTKVKLPYTILKDAPDTGSFPEVIGDFSTAKYYEGQIKSLVSKRDFRKIVVSSPIEFERLKRIFENSNKGVEVFFILEYLMNKLKLLNSKKIVRMKGNYAIIDNQIISKYFGYDFVRKILKNLGCGIVEVMHSKREFFSLGTGTGFDILFPEKTLKLAEIYLKEAEAAGADYIVTCDPMEYKALKTAKKSYKTKVQVTDVLFVAGKSLKWSF